MTDDGFERLKLDEGFSGHAYVDSVGVLTIGYGTNLKQGISKKQAEYLAWFELISNRNKLMLLSWFEELNSVRQDVIENMAYNLGIMGVLNFRKMILAIQKHAYSIAADEMLDSLWARQVGDRAKRLSDRMRIGE